MKPYLFFALLFFPLLPLPLGATSEFRFEFATNQPGVVVDSEVADDELVVIGSTGTIFRSSDGRSFTPFPRATNETLLTVVNTSATWFVAGTGGTLLQRENGGPMWQPVANPAVGNLSVASGNGVLVLKGDLALHQSTDLGATWTTVGGITPGDEIVTFTGGLFLTVSPEGHVLSSADGLTWMASTTPTDGLKDFVSVDGKYLATDGRFLFGSPDAMTWVGDKKLYSGLLNIT